MPETKPFPCSPENAAIAPDLLDVLACPRCRGSITLLTTPCAAPAGSFRAGIACAACNEVYPVVKGIPVMLAEEAQPRAQWEAATK